MGYCTLFVRRINGCYIQERWEMDEETKQGGFCSIVRLYHVTTDVNAYGSCERYMEA